MKKLKELYKQTERSMMRDVYPELCELLKLKHREFISIPAFKTFADTQIYANGSTTIFITEGDPPRSRWHTIGNILKDSECPRYLRAIRLDSLPTYIDYCEKILELTISLRKEEHRIQNFINTADAFASSKTRTVIVEKVV